MELSGALFASDLNDLLYAKTNLKRLNMKTRVKLIKKHYGDDYWWGDFENIWNPQGTFIIDFPYPDDMENGDEAYLELIPIEEESV
jgi:hypothetical protein